MFSSGVLPPLHLAHRDAIAQQRQRRPIERGLLYLKPDTFIIGDLQSRGMEMVGKKPAQAFDANGPP